MARTSEINNDFYNHLGERWYEAYDDPSALLRAEHRAMLPWITEIFKGEELADAKLLDVGCGAGLFSNQIVKQGYQVTGVDLSEESLSVAKLHDESKSVEYIKADAMNLPFENEKFEIVCCLDFLEHVNQPEAVVAEVSRVLRPGGLFIFHTFDRTFLSWLVIIKFVEWFVKNTPKNMHVHQLFIRPHEMQHYCEQNGLSVLEMRGLKPRLTSIDWKLALKGEVSPTMEFTLTSQAGMSYLGVAKKIIHQ